MFGSKEKEKKTLCDALLKYILTYLSNICVLDKGGGCSFFSFNPLSAPPPQLSITNHERRPSPTHDDDESRTIDDENVAYLLHPNVNNGANIIYPPPPPSNPRTSSLFLPIAMSTREIRKTNIQIQKPRYLSCPSFPFPSHSTPSRKRRIMCEVGRGELFIGGRPISQCAQSETGGEREYSPSRGDRILQFYSSTPPSLPPHPTPERKTSRLGDGSGPTFLPAWAVWFARAGRRSG